MTVEYFAADSLTGKFPAQRLLYFRGLLSIIGDLFIVLQPRDNQPYHLLVFTDNGHIHRTGVLVLQTPPIVPIINIRSVGLAVGAGNLIGAEFQRPTRPAQDAEEEKQEEIDSCLHEGLYWPVGTTGDAISRAHLQPSQFIRVLGSAPFR